MCGFTEAYTRHSSLTSIYRLDYEGSTVAMANESGASVSQEPLVPYSSVVHRTFKSVSPPCLDRNSIITCTLSKDQLVFLYYLF